MFHFSFILLGNPFPPILPQRTDERNFIHNVLLDEAKKAYRAEKYEQITKSLEDQIENPEASHN